MKPKAVARDWLGKRCGRHVNVETRMVNAAIAPLVNDGLLTRGRIRNPDLEDGSEDPAQLLDVYEVGAVSYNLGDLPDDIEVHIRPEPVEQLEMTFDDGTSMLVTVLITAVREEER